MAKAHVMMVPYPAQGHVIPMLELAHVLARRHVRITFVNVEFIHELVVVGSDDHGDAGCLIRLVSIADGLTSEERVIPEKFIETVGRVVPQKVGELVGELNKTAKEKEGEKVTCLVCDHHLCRIQEVAKRMGIQSALFSVVPAAMFVQIFNVPKLIKDGVIDDEGAPIKNEAVEFAASMPIMNPSDFIWHRENKTDQKLIFNIMRQETYFLKSADWLLCTSAYELEEGAYTQLPPQIVPIGPLLARNRQGTSAGHFFKQDLDCMEWLDQQPPCSVIYVAFGSTAIMSNTQFQELAMGLEETNRPFLWVVRRDPIAGAEKLHFPEGFMERVSGRGRITGWAPQQKVLSHPSIAGFLSHCGWNSILESVSNGVPILCWPYFSDQFVIQSYNCDIWRVGLRFERDRSGNITSGEFKKKIELLVGGDEFKGRAEELKRKVGNSVREGGNSYKNLTNFLTWIHHK